MERGEWQSRRHPGLSWQLVLGEFLDTVARAPDPPDVIFYDMWSSKTSPAVWTLDAFRRLFAACGARAVELFTYSSSTAVRAALLAAGFHIARGRATGDVPETTIALTPAALWSKGPREMLGAEWLARWERSDAKFPSDVPEEARAEFAQRIRAHPQFSGPALEA